jgi:hypothetical protein
MLTLASLGLVGVGVALVGNSSCHPAGDNGPGLGCFGGVAALAAGGVGAIAGVGWLLYSRGAQVDVASAGPSRRR